MRHEREFRANVIRRYGPRIFVIEDAAKAANKHIKNRIYFIADCKYPNSESSFLLIARVIRLINVSSFAIISLSIVIDL